MKNTNAQALGKLSAESRKGKTDYSELAKKRWTQEIETLNEENTDKLVYVKTRSNKEAKYLIAQVDLAISDDYTEYQNTLADRVLADSSDSNVEAYNQAVQNWNTYAKYTDPKTLITTGCNIEDVVKNNRTN